MICDHKNQNKIEKQRVGWGKHLITIMIIVNVYDDDDDEGNSNEVVFVDDIDNDLDEVGFGWFRRSVPW